MKALATGLLIMVGGCEISVTSPKCTEETAKYEIWVDSPTFAAQWQSVEDREADGWICTRKSIYGPSRSIPNSIIGGSSVSCTICR
jgi:hypothetical protein